MTSNNKIVLDINIILYNLHHILIKYTNPKHLEELYFLPTHRWPMDDKIRKLYNLSYIKKHVSSEPYLPWIGGVMLESYLNKFILINNHHLVNHELYKHNPILYKLKLPYINFIDTSLPELFEWLCMYGYDIRNDRDRLLLLTLFKECENIVTSYTNNNPDILYNVDLSKEICTLNYLEDIRGYRLKEAEEELINKEE